MNRQQNPNLASDDDLMGGVGMASDFLMHNVLHRSFLNESCLGLLRGAGAFRSCLLAHFFIPTRAIINFLWTYFTLSRDARVSF